MSPVFTIVGWLKISAGGQTFDSLAMKFPTIKQEIYISGDIKTTKFSHSDSKNTMEWYSRDFELEFYIYPEQTNLMFQLFLLPFASSNIRTAIVLMDVVQEVFDLLDPDLAFSISIEDLKYIDREINIENILDHLSSMIYISKSLSPRDIFNDNKNLYRVHLCDNGYLISATYGPGNEKPWLLYTPDGNSVVDESISDLLVEASLKHDAEVNSILKSIIINE